MLYLHENLKRYRMQKNLTQEDIAQYLRITPQSVSKWERGESYPDITFLPALANILETSIDALIGMDAIRSEQARYQIHKTANGFQHNGDYPSAERVYRDALLTYPNEPGMMLGLAGALALQGKSEEAVERMEKALPCSTNEKQKSTARAVLCFLYLKCGRMEKANALAASLPHIRESREIIQPLLSKGMENDEMDRQIKTILLGEDQSL